MREAQAWIARAQEMDALQSQSLQGELRERTEQCQQLWLGWQRQVSYLAYMMSLIYDVYDCILVYLVLHV